MSHNSLVYKAPYSLTQDKTYKYHIRIRLDLLILHLPNKIYMPSFDIHHMSVANLLDRLYTHGSENFKVDKEHEFSDEWKTLMKAREDYYRDASQVLLKDL